jgi:hypothetical protein
MGLQGRDPADQEAGNTGGGSVLKQLSAISRQPSGKAAMGDFENRF